MPSSKERDAESDDRSRDKPTGSRTDRKDRDRERPRDKERDREADAGKERERDRDGDRERPRRHKSKPSKSKNAESELLFSSQKRHRTKDKDKDRDRDRDRERDGTASPSPAPSPLTEAVPELSRTKMSSTERIPMPYPSFSKAHSKEDVRYKEDASSPASASRCDPLTPDATDVGMQRSKSVDYTSSKNRKDSPAPQDDRPPSPPETDFSAGKGADSASAPRQERDGDSGRPRSWVSSSTSKNEAKSKVSLRSKTSKTSSQATWVKAPAIRPPAVKTGQDGSSLLQRGRASEASGATVTSVATKRISSEGRLAMGETDFSPESAPDSSPKTPIQVPQFPPPMDGDAKAHIQFVGEAQGDDEQDQSTPSQTPGKKAAMAPAPPPPPPAPPPPPPLSIQEAPRVDYLLQNGGLPQPVPRTFLAVLPRQNGTRPSNPPLSGAETLFAPFFNLLNQYQTVITKHGSVAVATGHRTVARRLLDRLEDVFNRDLPPEGCSCVICERSDEAHRGLGWGEVLERASGRIDLPSWPPFDLAALGIKAVDASADVPPRPDSPVKIDPDIAEEFREHYLRQSKKVRSAVDKWLTSCAEAPAPPPTDVDDETLTFAILTNLDAEDRPFFNALMSGSRELQPATRAPTPMRKPRLDFIVKTGLALQRLYRLPKAPRDAETVVYLVKNKDTHDLLHTITDINPSEWEILMSGRFDGFLWSGADDDAITPTGPPDVLSRGSTPGHGRSSFFPPAPPSRASAMSPQDTGLFRSFTPGFGLGMASRTTTPFSGLGSISRGTTPASFASGLPSRGITPASFAGSISSPLNGSGSAGGTPTKPAVSLDEETEVAVLAEIEREIYSGMEALEDAFEQLHERAEAVREALRTRGAALAVALQHRRGGVLGGAGGIDVLPQSGDSGRFDRPSWAGGAAGDEELASLASESDWGADDMESIAPDDSASNVSSSRHRRPKRRNERRTPAPIEEDFEEA